jgi:hypothetical protein
LAASLKSSLVGRVCCICQAFIGALLLHLAVAVQTGWRTSRLSSSRHAVVHNCERFLLLLLLGTAGRSGNFLHVACCGRHAVFQNGY